MKKTKMLSGLLAVVLVFGLALAGCGSKVQGEPGDAVLGCMESFKAMDFDAMANYVSKTEEIQTLKDEFSSEDLDIVKMVLKRATFEVVSTDKASDGKTAEVTLKITNVDMNEAMTVAQENLMAWAIEEAAKPAAEQPTEDEIMAKTMEMLDAAISAEDAKTLSSEVTVPTAVEENTWIVTDLPDDVLNALAGGMEL